MSRLTFARSAGAAGPKIDGRTIYMYMLYYGGEWSTGYTRVVSFDRARGRSPSGLSKLTTSVNRVDHKHSAIV